MAEKFLVLWASGTWYVGWPDRGQPIESRDWLEEWLAARGASMADLTFGAKHPGEPFFVDDFGPLS